MPLFATTTALEKIQKVPPLWWLKASLFILGFIAVVILLRKIAHMNKMVLGVIVFVVVVGLGFSWVYERNEPAFMTPLVNRVAPFFPAKGSYGAQQHSSP